MRRSMLAGAIGGVVAVFVLAILGAVMMRRMMSCGCCADGMRACMEKCGCGGPEEPEQAGPGEE